MKFYPSEVLSMCVNRSTVDV